jgi:dTDP-glucose 4,6-dehydratase
LNLAGALEDNRVAFVKADIADRSAMTTLFMAERPSAIVNLAAETHVDRSIDGPAPFIETNIVGTFVLLECALALTRTMAPDDQRAFRFLHVSTDEVYGTLGPVGRFTEETAYAPNSPYAASKASADHLVRAYFHTYGLPAIITNCSNNYGPYQFPEKLIPLVILNALDGRPLPIYGDGGNVRDWLQVGDHCAGILAALERGTPGEKYNIGGDSERTNLEVVDGICEALDALVPARDNAALTGRPSYHDLKTFVPDRPGHDRRYAIDAGKIASELGWHPSHDFTSGLRATVAWYVNNRDWCRAVQAGRYDRERLGVR